MTTVQPEAIHRDAERSKTAILQAATDLFCAQGFNATTIGDIAATAQVARGTPAYFFGNKEDLYKAVLERVLSQADQIVPNALLQAGTNPDSTRLLEVFTDSYMDFHHHHPEFLRMIHWISLERNNLMNQVQAHWGTISTMMQAVMMTLKGTRLEHDDQRHVVLSIVGMCNAHLMYGETLAIPMGLLPNSSEFLEQRKTHVKQMLKAIIVNPDLRTR